MAEKREPPFFNDDNLGVINYKLPFYETMELLIETLTGTCFQLRVSPFETIISVKAKIQRLEGRFAFIAHVEESSVIDNFFVCRHGEFLGEF